MSNIISMRTVWLPGRLGIAVPIAAGNLPSVVDNSGTEDLTMVHHRISTCPNREGCLALSRALLAAGLAGGHDCDCERSAQARLSMRSASPRTGYIASESRQ